MREWTQTVTAKVIGIALLALLMVIPLTQVSQLVAERQQMREQALTQIARGWGGRQVLGGLLLAVPMRQPITGDDSAVTGWRPGSEVVLADDTHVDLAMQVEMRGYGIYAAPTFRSTVTLSGHFLASDIAQFRRDAHGRWQGGQAELRLLLGDLRGLQDVRDLLINGKPAQFESSAEQVAGYPGVVVPIDLDALDGQPIAFSMTLTLAGTESMQLLPLARTTDVRMKAPWRDPGFIGAALPLEHTIDAHGFAAHWHMLDLNRRFGQHWDKGERGIADVVRSSGFGVQLYQPVDVYQRNLRAGKYGLLFIAMTFVAFFLFEVLRQLRVHPVQYLLVGAALATFYVLLLALSEQIAFAAAYAVAASSVVLIVGGYATAVLHARRAGLTLGGVLAMVYGLLYGLIAAQQYALLIGAVVLLVTVALLMYLTRRIDWYGYASPGATPAIMERS